MFAGLHLAASTGNQAIVDLLLTANANVNAKDRWGNTPLRDAVRMSHESVALSLFENGSKLWYDETTAR